MSAYVVVFNPQSTPVTVEDGRTVAGGEWAAVRRRADEVRQAVDANLLLVVPKPEDMGGVADSARVAFEEADRFNNPPQESSKGSDKGDKSKGA